MPDLSDPDYAAFAWGRYWRLLRWMVLAAIGAVIVSLAGLRLATGPLPLHLAIATALGVFLSVLIAAALMGLVFLSDGTGHDASVGETGSKLKGRKK